MPRDRFKPHPEDFIIVVMGPTGSGKTHFINSITGYTESRSAAGLQSDTRNITPYRISYPGLSLVLVDTPGFDDTHRSDTQILKAIADWLVQKYPDGTTLKIAGIIYLHRITDPRMSGSALQNLLMFGRLCGHVPLPRTRLVTTMWDQAKRAVATQREAELTDDFWRKLIDRGAIHRRFYNNPDSAREIVHQLLRLGNDGDELLLQEEPVEQQKYLNETEVGKVLYNRLQKLLADQKRTLKELIEEAKLQRDPVLVKGLQEECEKVDLQIQKTSEEMKEMKTPLSRRVILWLFGRKSRSRVIELDCLRT